jgi:hypothetical protein
MNNKTFLFLIGAGAIIATIFFYTCKKSKEVAKLPIVEPKEIVKVVVQNEDKYKKKYDSLSYINTTLMIKGRMLQMNLSDAQVYGKVLESAMRKTVTENPIPKEVEESLNFIINESNERDNMCNDLVSNLNETIINKDSMLLLKDTLYSKLRSSFNFTINQSQLLIDYNKSLNKDIKRKKLANLFWKATTVAAGLLIIKNNIK